MLGFKKQRAESEPLNDQVIFAWDKDEGVWALEATAEIFDDLKLLLGEQFLHWHEALESCGAVHYNHWRDCRWSKAAIEKSLDEGFATRPLFGTMSYLRSLRSFEAEDVYISTNQRHAS
ncbi:hypothetical protein N7460_000874 [Penicillium canescens]|uniref:Uncharacterized protein n=1 Tax=Penicillium canescens TaxID=5083 RepID=A0AAD6ING6_PENCN|nr:hypothetical protein N7460_000874 [Penicillium canescens]KAJ6170143.1 hypothetical protein N7485_007489 [Penicillium canescens]